MFIFRPNPCASQSGLSLLETLVAFSILAISLSVILNIFARSSRAIGYAKTVDQAVFIAETQLLQLLHEDNQNNAAHGNNGIYHWQITKKPYTSEKIFEALNDDVKLLEIAIQVTWQDFRARKIVLHTLQLDQRYDE